MEVITQQQLEAQKAKLDSREEELNKRDEVYAELNKKLNAAIQKQNESLEKERQELFDKSREIQKLRNELSEKKSNLEAEYQQKLSELNTEKQALQSDKKKLESGYETQLQRQCRAKLVEFHDKLEEEFTKQFGEKIQRLEQQEKNLQNREAKLRVGENSLEAERESFKSEKNAKVKILEEELDFINSEYEKLSVDYEGLISERNEFNLYKDRNLLEEIKNLKECKKSLEKQLDDERKEQEERINKLYDEVQNAKKIYDYELDKIRRYDAQEKELDNLKIEKENLESQLKEQDYYKNEVARWQKKVEELQATFLGTQEQQERKKAIIKEVEQNPQCQIQISKNNQCQETDETQWLNSIETRMKDYGLNYPRRLLDAFHTMLKTASYSPLSVLSGVSGTGKSELPKLYSYFGGFNFLSEAVQPTWDSPSSMIGFFNTIENKFDSTAIFKFLLQTSLNSGPNSFGLKESMNLILLDEFNLAHIELYFAEFLSKFETKRGSDNVNLQIPIGAGMDMKILLDSNLLWVGSMNEDESTKSLSDKVLDRAFCLNFPRPKKLADRKDIKKLGDIQPFKWLPKTTWEKWQQEANDKTKDINLDTYKKAVESINEAMAKAHRAIGHRVWQSMAAYMRNHPKVVYGDREQGLKLAFTDQIVQKIMPKLRGIETQGAEKKTLTEIKEIIIKHAPSLEKDFDYAMRNPYGQFKFDSAEYLEEYGVKSNADLQHKNVEHTSNTAHNQSKK